MKNLVRTRGMRAAVLGFISAACLATASVCRADLWIQGYSAKLHDRFFTGADRAFIGETYDWSGVGQVNGGTWGIMISPTYYVTANHWHSTSGSLTFYADNTTSSAHSYAIDSSFGRAMGDLYLGRLTAPIPESDNIAYYPILQFPTIDEYYGQEIFVCGKPNRVGRNRINSINNQTHIMSYFYDPYGRPYTVGDDEAYLDVGDSGGPSFVAVGGILALVGTHFGNLADPPPEYGYDCGDYFVPDCIDWLNANMTGEQVSVIPEPGASAMLLGGGLTLWLMLRRRRNRQPSCRSL